MKAIAHIYDNHEVHFLSSGKDNLMVNATEMARIFGKQVVAFLRNDDTKRFIEECLKSENSHFLSVKNESDLILSKQKSGTWMHRILALKFAAWLDPSFELWVYSTIDQIILGHYAELKQATIEKEVTKQELAQRKQELMTKNPEYAKIVELEEKLNGADKRRVKALRASTNQLRLNLFPELLS